MLDQTFEISLLLLMFLVEVILALAVVVIVLIFLNRAKKILVEKLLAKLKQKVPEETPEEEAPPEDPVEQTQITSLSNEPSYQDYLSDALANTKDYYQLCFESDKVVLDNDSSQDQQTIALRHTFLLAEKSLLNTDEKTPEFWSQLKNRLKKIIMAYQVVEEEDEDEDSGEVERLNSEVAGLKQRISNLEMFKKLFFDLQNKCQEISEQGEEIHQQAQTLADTLDNEDLNVLLEKYQHNFSELGQAANHAPTVSHTAVQSTHEQKVVTQVLQVNKLDEVNQLKDVADGQHRLITKLRGELLDLQNAESNEAAAEKVAAIAQNIQQLESSLSQSEMCVQMLEDDYHEATVHINQLETQLETQQQEKNDLQSTITDSEGALANAHSELSNAQSQLTDSQTQLTHLQSELTQAQQSQASTTQLANESKELMSCISTLEDENISLNALVKKLKVKLKSKRASVGSDVTLKKKIAEKDSEIIRLQTEYSTLEGQYLEIFQKLNSQ